MAYACVWYERLPRPAGILFTDAVGLPNWVTAGAEVDLPLPLPTLIGIEVILFALLELKRYEGFKKTGKARALASRVLLLRLWLPTSQTEATLDGGILKHTALLLWVTFSCWLTV